MAFQPWKKKNTNASEQSTCTWWIGAEKRIVVLKTGDILSWQVPTAVEDVRSVDSVVVCWFRKECVKSNQPSRPAHIRISYLAMSACNTRQGKLHPKFALTRSFLWIRESQSVSKRRMFPDTVPSSNTRGKLSLHQGLRGLNSTSVPPVSKKARYNVRHYVGDRSNLPHGYLCLPCLKTRTASEWTKHVKHNIHWTKCETAARSNAHDCSSLLHHEKLFVCPRSST